MTNVQLPRIDEESTSVFSGSITNEEMLDCISGNNSVCRNSLEFTIYSGFDADDRANKTSSPGPDHYMLEERMAHATSTRSIQVTTTANTDDKIIHNPI